MCYSRATFAITPCHLMRYQGFSYPEYECVACEANKPPVHAFEAIARIGAVLELMVETPEGGPSRSPHLRHYRCQGGGSNCDGCCFMAWHLRWSREVPLSCRAITGMSAFFVSPTRLLRNAPTSFTSR